MPALSWPDKASSNRSPPYPSTQLECELACVDCALEKLRRLHVFLRDLEQFPFLETHMGRQQFSKTFERCSVRLR